METAEILKLIKQAGKLKRLKRTGWQQVGVPNPESVADHTCRVAFISMILAPRLGLDALKLIQMSLVHDLAESIVGDITPHCGISVGKKRRMEEKAFRSLIDNFPNGRSLLDLWIEYEDQKSPEARALKNIDKLEMAIQAEEYRAQFPQKDLDPFITHSASCIDHPEIRKLFEELIRK